MNEVIKELLADKQKLIDENINHRSRLITLEDEIEKLKKESYRCKLDDLRSENEVLKLENKKLKELLNYESIQSSCSN